MPREARLAREAIKAFDLDLSGLTVLTEAATGPFALGPGICLLAGARRVLALAADSRHGTARQATEQVMAGAETLGGQGEVAFVTARDDARLSEADIVTNAGPVRPIDAGLIERLGQRAVVPLMFETWEHRPGDVDLAACRKAGIPVLGTDESDPRLETMRYLAPLAMKLLFSLEVELVRSRLAVLGGEAFGRHIVGGLTKAGVACEQLLPADLTDAALPDRLALTDGLIIAEHEDRSMLIGPGGLLSAERLAEMCPTLAVIHICGGADREALIGAGLRCAPDRFASAGSMSVTTAWLGPRPFIDLFTAGLKVGQAMREAESAACPGWRRRWRRWRWGRPRRGFPGCMTRLAEGDHAICRAGQNQVAP